MRKYILLALVFLTTCTAFGQDFSNKGKDFWVAYGYHQVMGPTGTGANSQDMVLYFATDQVTNILISIPSIGFTQNLTSAAGNNVLTSFTIPKNAPSDARLFTEGQSNKGIHITSDKPMVAYAHIYNASVSGATILYPTNTLGREYYSVNYKNWSNSTNANCWFYVIATDTGTTTIKITPSGNTEGGWTAGTTYTVNLTQGQVYFVKASLLVNGGCGGGTQPPCTSFDLTGSLIQSTNNGSGCKKIAVFSGSGRISISCDNFASSSDNYMVQAMPKNAWGKKYLTVPANGNQAYNIYRVCVSHPAAIVKINGAVTGLPLINNFYYEIPFTNQPQLVEADSAIMVAQYFTSQGECSNGNPGDPEVIYLSAVEQSINKVLWNATPNFGISTHSFNVVIPNKGTAISSFTLDGSTVPAASFTLHPQDANYSYLRLPVGAGPRVIQSDSGFNAIAYGFGAAESYGYNAGTNIKDLYQQIGVKTQYGIETTPSVCTNSPFKFKVSLPYIPDSMRWNFNGAAGMFPNNNTVYVNNIPNTEDSFTVVNGRTIHWYSIPIQYSFSSVGVYPVTITTFVPNGECGSEQDIDFDLTVSDPPTASFTWVPGGCLAETYQFTETTPQFPKSTYYFWWTFGDPGSGSNDTSFLRNPSHLFTTPGPHTVKYFAITTPGCFSDTIIQVVNVPDIPSATISAANTAVCINSAPPPDITFTATQGTPPFTFTYTINAGAPLTINSLGTNYSVTIQHPTNVANTFIYNLTGVRNATPAGTPCTRNITGQSVTVNITADATITLTSAPTTNNQTVCINNPIINITYSVAGSGTGGSVSGLPAGVTGTFAGGIVSIIGTPTVPGIFNYTVSTTGPCVTPQALGTITVTDDATLALTSGTGTDNQTLCINTPILTNITYAVGGTGTGGLVSGLPAGVTGVYAGGVITISGTPTVSGVFNYTVTTTGPCIRPSATGTITVTGNATLTLTSAIGTNNQTRCLNVAITNITYAVGGTGTGGNVSGLPAGVIGIFAAGVVTISGTPTAAGTFNYTVSTTGPCVIPQAFGTITVIDDATLALTSGPGTDNQTLCINTPILTNITYAVGGSGTGGSVTGLPAGVTGVYAGGVITISGTASVSGVFNYTVTTTGPCVRPNATGTITVTGDATLTLTSAAGTDNQTRCINVAITNITYSVGGTGTGGSVSGLPPGVTGVFAGGVITIAGTPTSIGSYTYTIITAGPCNIPTTTGTINVNPDASITLTSAAPTTSQELCRNSPITNITYAIAGGGTGAGVTGLPAGVTGVYAGGVFTISGIPTVAGLFNYTVTTTGTCVQNSLGGTILVNQLPTASFTFTSPSCETRVISFTDASTPNSGVLNAWTWNFGDASPLDNTQNPTHVYAVAGTYTVTLTVNTDKGCTSNPIASVTVTINHRPEAGFIVPEVCINDVATPFTDTSKIAVGTINRPLNEWNYGDPGSGPANTSTGTNGLHLYTATGVYQVTQIVTSSLGCRDTIVLPITINSADPVSNFSITNQGGLCSSDSVELVNLSTVGFGNVTRLEIYWDNVGTPAVFETVNVPVFNGITRHKYPTLTTNRNYVIRMIAYSGAICFAQRITPITVYANPVVQVNNYPASCFLVPPYLLTQGSEIGGVPGTFAYSGPGITNPNGTFNPQLAGVGVHPITYTWTASNPGACIDTLTKFITVLDTAHATFSVALPSCEKVPTVFTNLSTAPASVTLLSTVWNFGDLTGPQTFPIGSPITHLYAGPGSYTVTMHNVSTAGCLSTDTSAVITIDANHIITRDLTSGSQNQTRCVNVAIQDIRYLLSGGANNIMPAVGLPPGVTASVTGNVVTITGAPTTAVGSPFAYTITTMGNTCQVATTTGVITVEPDHIISRILTAGDSAQSVCVNTAIDPIVYNLGGGASTAVALGLPAGVTGVPTAGNTFTISGTPTSSTGSPFNFTIQTNGNACIKANTIGEIKVNPYPVPDFTFDKGSYCIPNATVGFINNTTPAPLGNYTYKWYFGDGDSSSAVTPSHFYITEGPFSVILKARSTVILNGGVVGCESSKTNPLNIIHPQPKADFVFSKPNVCIGDQVIITDATDGKDGIVNEWHWDLGDGTTTTVNPVNHTYADTITYVITMYSVNSFGCKSDTINKLPLIGAPYKPFSVYPYPHVNAGPDKSVLEGGSVQLDATAFANNAQYTWTPNLYLTDANALRPRVVSPKTDMTYRLTVKGSGGCELSDNVFVKLLRFPVIPNTFTPNNDGRNDKWVISFLNTYPNNRVQIFTRSGNLVFESRGYNTPWDGTMKGKPLPFDTYYYIIEPGNGRDPITGYVTIIK